MFNLTRICRKVAISYKDLPVSNSVVVKEYAEFSAKSLPVSDYKLKISIFFIIPMILFIL